MKPPLLLLICVAALTLAGCATKPPKKPDVAPVSIGNQDARESNAEARKATADIRKDLEELEKLTR